MAFLKKTILRLIAIPIGIAAVVFCVNNRDDVTINLWPISSMIEIPIYSLILGILAFGLILGVLISYMPKIRLNKKLPKEPDTADRRPLMGIK